MKNENNQLVVYVSPDVKDPLYAAWEATFYSTAQFLNLAFQINNEDIRGFQPETFSGSEFVTKVNE